MKTVTDELLKIITKRIFKRKMCLTNKNQKCTGQPLIECLPCAKKILKGGEEINNVD